jgi:hypothetical protein
MCPPPCLCLSYLDKIHFSLLHQIEQQQWPAAEIQSQLGLTLTTSEYEQCTVLLLRSHLMVEKKAHVCILYAWFAESNSMSG